LILGAGTFRIMTCKEINRNMVYKRLI